MEIKWFVVDGDIDNLNNNIFESLKNMEASSNKMVKIKDRSIDLNKRTGFLCATVRVTCE